MTAQIKQLVDAATLIARLQALGHELAEARRANAELKVSQTHEREMLATAEALVLDAVKDEYWALKNDAQRQHYKAMLFQYTPEVHTQATKVTDVEAKQTEASERLNGLLDELTTIRYTIRLCEALALDAFGSDSSNVAETGVVARLAEGVTTTGGALPLLYSDDDDDDVLPF